VIFIILSIVAQIFSYTFLLMGKSRWRNLQEINVHNSMGYSCLAMYLVQFFLGIFMDKERKGTRIILLNLLHMILGHANVILAG